MFNSTNDKDLGSLKELFLRQPVAELSTLRKALGVRSRTTVFLALKAVGYYSSYTHAGRYYTLAHIPCFDGRGLWSHGEVRFSKHGTLRATVVVLVRQSADGYTHDELQALLGIRVHDTLRSLVNDELLGRQRVEAVYVYTDSAPERAVTQLEQRRSRIVRPLGTAQLSPGSLDLRLVVDILVTVIHRPKDSVAEIAARLGRDGFSVSAEQVEGVFAQYGLQKKTARFRSKRSRR